MGSQLWVRRVWPIASWDRDRPSDSRFDFALNSTLVDFWDGRQNIPAFGQDEIKIWGSDWEPGRAMTLKDDC